MLITFAAAAAVLAWPCMAASPPLEWSDIYGAETQRQLVKAWPDWPKQKKLPEPQVSFGFFSSDAHQDLLIHQEEYTGGGAYSRWYVLETIDNDGHPRIIAEGHRKTSNFIQARGHTVLESDDGQFIELQDWASDHLRTLLRYHSHELNFQVSEPFRTFRIIDPATGNITIVSYAEERDPQIAVDNYMWTEGGWKIKDSNLELTSDMRSALIKRDRMLETWLKDVHSEQRDAERRNQ
jgi:hypothetical protein